MNIWGIPVYSEEKKKATCVNEFLLLFESIESVFSLISHERMCKVIILSKASCYTACKLNAVLKIIFLDPELI